METMKAAFLCGAGNLELRELQRPTPGEEQVLVKIESVGICGSDVHYYTHGRMGHFVASEPLILGHESAGIIVETGKKSSKLSEGDRVALEPGVPCGSCEYCKRGRYNLCSRVKFLASAPFQHGALAEYIAYSENYAHKLSSGISSDEGALAEPLAVAVYVLRRAGLTLGKSIAILGSGPVGLLLIQVAKLMGASEIYAVDLYENRLSLAKKFGATVAIQAEEVNPVQQIMDLTRGNGVDIAIEAAGALVTTQQAIDLTTRGGTVVLVGWVAEGILPLNLEQVGVKELEIKGIFRYCNVYPEAINLLEKKHVDVLSLITHRYSLDKIAEAFSCSKEGKGSSIKIIIEM